MADFEGVWAVVTAGMKQYVGRLHTGSGTSILGVTQESKDEIQEHIMTTGWVLVKPVYQYVELLGPSPEGLQRLIQVLPIGPLANDIAMNVKPSDVAHFDDMQESDQKKYKSLVEKARTMMKATKAQDSNIIPARTMPGGQVGRAH